MLFVKANPLNSLLEGEIVLAGIFWLPLKVRLISQDVIPLA